MQGHASISLFAYCTGNGMINWHWSFIDCWACICPTSGSTADEMRQQWFVLHTGNENLFWQGRCLMLPDFVTCTHGTALTHTTAVLSAAGGSKDLTFISVLISKRTETSTTPVSHLCTTPCNDNWYHSQRLKCLITDCLFYFCNTEIMQREKERKKKREKKKAVNYCQQISIIY